MKCFIVLLALCALVATVVVAAPHHHLKHRHLQSPSVVLQQRTWTKSKSKLTAMRRSSEEGLIGMTQFTNLNLFTTIV